jgi:hypothetical protein
MEEKRCLGGTGEGTYIARECSSGGGMICVCLWRVLSYQHVGSSHSLVLVCGTRIELRCAFHPCLATLLPTWEISRAHCHRISGAAVMDRLTYCNLKSLTPSIVFKILDIVLQGQRLTTRCPCNHKSCRQH